MGAGAVVTCDITGSLAHIHRLVPAAMPEAEQLLSQPKRRPQVLQGFWGALP